jgi:hypothetical protein
MSRWTGGPFSNGTSRWGSSLDLGVNTPRR